MPCPFPGMDPYRENPAIWPDVHDSLIVYSRDALQPLLQPHYYARISERLYFNTSEEVWVEELLQNAGLRAGRALS